MRLLQKTLCLAAALVLCAAPARAESDYKATELTFPEIQGQAIQSLSVHGGRLDLFTETQTRVSPPKYVTRRFHSDDGGMTWKETDAAWLNALQGESGWQPRTGVRKDGTVYALLGKNGQVDLPTGGGYNYFIGTLAVNKDGAAKTLRTLDDPDVLPYRVIGNNLSQEGDVALLATGHEAAQKNGREVSNRLLTLDPATGAEKTSAAFGAPPERSVPKAFDNGMFYVVKKGQVKAVDTAGKTVSAIDRLAESDIKGFSGGWAAAGGAFYELNGQGLFRFRPGETSWTKLLDSSVCKLGTAGSEQTDCGALNVDADGSVTILLRHSTADQREDLRTAAWTLTRYTPQT